MIRRIEVGGETLCYELVQTQRRSIELRAAAQGAKVFAPRGVSLKVVDGFVRQRADCGKPRRVWRITAKPT